MVSRHAWELFDTPGMSLKGHWMRGAGGWVGSTFLCLVGDFFADSTMPIGMYGIFTYIYHKNQLNVGRYTMTMDPMGW